ncbi:MAG: hexosaminidase [Rhodothermales bacterium]|jgi:hexosaminidase
MDFPQLYPRPKSLRVADSAMRPPLSLRLVEDPDLAPQEFRLSGAGSCCELRSNNAAGLRYGLRAWEQIQASGIPQEFEIHDAPAFPTRGFMLDVSRCKVPTMETLLGLLPLLAGLRYNQLQLYIEHSFAFADHEVVWKDASPFTGDEIRHIADECAKLGIELVPNLNSFGHMERWLQHPAYAHLAECPDGFSEPYESAHGTTLYPDAASLQFLDSLYAEYLPHFPGELFNIGCDETWELGVGRAKAACESRGKERVYLDFLGKIEGLVRARGRKTMFWGDIILRQPELIGQLPDGIIALNWGYEANHPFESETAQFRESGVPFYVCPGTSSWNSITGRTANWLANLAAAAEHGAANGAIGYLVTDWGDNGHHQTLPISVPGIVAGAGFSWGMQNRDADFAAVMDQQVFHDEAGVLGQLLLDLGRVADLVPWQRDNCSIFGHILRYGEALEFAEFADCHTELDALEVRLANAQPEEPFVIDEIRHSIALARHAMTRGPDLPDLVARHRELWLRRNRPGGLKESCERLTNPWKQAK